MKTLSRRTFLTGAGCAIGLPLLEAMVPRRAFAQGMPAPRRIIAYYVPCGIHMAGWTPAQEGAAYALTPILADLAPVKDDVLVISGLANRPARPDGPGDHASGTGAFLTCAHPFKTEGADIMNGISMDQVAANAIGSATLFPSLQLGTEGGGSTGDCDSGYSCAYARNISWADANTPLAKETNPQAVFDRLFAGRDPAASAEQIRKRKLYRLSILDYVEESSLDLQAKLGKTDRQKLDEYLTGVRELETRIQALDSQPICQGERPNAPQSFTERVQIMSDLMVTAFSCDLTRVITFMLGNAGSNRVYDFLGIGDGHHQISHHQMNPTNLSQLQTIDTWEVSQLSYLLQRLKGVQEGTGTLLDNSLVFFSSEIEDGDTHAHTNMPVLLAGRGGGAIRTGRHLRFAQERKISELFISMLNTIGVPATTLGDGDRPLDGLT
jgi:hypothetical protein